MMRSMTRIPTFVATLSFLGLTGINPAWPDEQAGGKPAAQTMTSTQGVTRFVTPPTPRRTWRLYTLKDPSPWLKIGYRFRTKIDKAGRFVFVPRKNMSNDWKIAGWNGKKIIMSGHHESKYDWLCSSDAVTLDNGTEEESFYVALKMEENNDDIGVYVLGDCAEGVAKKPGGGRAMN